MAPRLVMGTPTQVSGDVVGDRYRMVRAMATGGYGTVYEAVSLAGGERLALKILHTKLGASTAELERFRREAALRRERRCRTLHRLRAASWPRAPSRARQARLARLGGGLCWLLA
jgi:hypothetical protein